MATSRRSDAYKIGTSLVAMMTEKLEDVLNAYSECLGHFGTKSVRMRQALTIDMDGTADSERNSWTY